MMPLWKNIILPKDNVVKRVLITILICLLILAASGFRFGVCDGTSMEPTIKNGDIVGCIDAWNIKPGDIIIFKTPEWEKWPRNMWMWQKRVDHINKNEFWVLGDNVEESYDSRHFGYINKSSIHKKVIFIIKR